MRPAAEGRAGLGPRRQLQSPGRPWSRRRTIRPVSPPRVRGLLRGWIRGLLLLNTPQLREGRRRHALVMDGSLRVERARGARLAGHRSPQIATAQSAAGTSLLQPAGSRWGPDRQEPLHNETATSKTWVPSPQDPGSREGGPHSPRSLFRWASAYVGRGGATGRAAAPGARVPPGRPHAPVPERFRFFSLDLSAAGLAFFFHQNRCRHVRD